MNFKTWDPLKTWRGYKPPKKYEKKLKRWVVCLGCGEEFISQSAKTCLDCQKQGK